MRIDILKKAEAQNKLKKKCAPFQILINKELKEEVNKIRVKKKIKWVTLIELLFRDFLEND